MTLKPFASLTMIALTAASYLPLSSHAASLADIYQLALNNDAQFKVAAANRDAGKLQGVIGRSALLPQINARASYTKSDGTSESYPARDISGAPLLNEPVTPVDSDSDVTSINYGVTLDQPLFDAATWYSYQQSKAATEITQVQFQLEQQNLILRTASAYFDALKAVDDLETAIAEEDALSHSLEQTQQRFEVGLTAITEVHEAQAEYDSAKANRLSREGDLVIAFEALEVLTGQTQLQVAPLKDNFPVTPPVPAERSEWVELAKNNNLNLQNARLSLNEAESNYKAARSRHLPTVSAQLGYSGADVDTDNGGPFISNNTNDGMSASVTLNVPLYSGGNVSARRQAAAFGKVAAKETFNQTERQIVQLTRSQHQRVNTAVATVHARRQAIVSNESALEATKAGYDVGTRNLVNVLDAQRRVYTAKRNFLSELYNYVLAGLELKQAAGTLSADDIAKLDQWLDKAQLVGLPAQ